MGIFENTSTSEFSGGVSEGFLTLPITANEVGITDLKVTADGRESEIKSLESIDYAKVITTIDDASTIFV